MKTLKLKYFIIATILLISSSVYSQSDTGHTYYTDDFSIRYFTGTPGKSTINTLKNINAVNFMNDSMIKLTYYYVNVDYLNINSIYEVSFQNNTNSKIGVWTGMILGGAICGYAAGADVSPGVGRVFSVIGGSVIGVLLGGYMGSALANLFPTYSTYDFKSHIKNKEKELKRILRINKQHHYSSDY